MTGSTLEGSPRISAISSADRPPATADEVATAWSRFKPIGSTAPSEVLAFLADRGLDPEVGRALGFRYRFVQGSGHCLGFHVGPGIKRRPIVPKEGGTRHHVEPSYHRVEMTTLPIVPGLDSRTRTWGDRASTVVVCESETDLWALGQSAPQCDLALMPAGAQTWREEWASPLRGYENILVATDNDEAGHSGAYKVALDIPSAKRFCPPAGTKDWCEALTSGAVTATDLEALLHGPFESIYQSRTDPRRVLGVAKNLSDQTGLALNTPAVVSLAVQDTNLPADFVRTVVEEAANPAPKVEGWSGSDLLELPKPEVRPEIFSNGQWLEGEMLGISAASGVGKTVLALQAGLSLALGLPFFLLPEVGIPRARRVLYVAGEGSGFSFCERYEQLLSAAIPLDQSSEALENFVALGALDIAGGTSAGSGPGGGIGLKLDLSSHMDLFLRQIDHHQPEVVIIDPVRPFHSRDENDSRDMEEFFHILRKALIRDRGLSLLLTHHVRKGTKLDGDAGRGGSWQENLATSWMLGRVTGSTDDEQRILLATKTRNGRNLPELRLTRDPVSLWHTARIAPTRETELRNLVEVVHDLLEDALEPQLWKRLASQLSLSAGKANDVLGLLKDDERIVVSQASTRGNPYLVALAPDAAGASGLLPPL